MNTYDTEAAHLVVTHSLAQTLRRWIPFPRTLPWSNLAWESILSWPADRWHEFLRRPADSEWPWQTLLRQGSVNPQGLGEQLAQLPLLRSLYHLIPYTSPEYPTHLRAIPDAPALLFARGEGSLLQRPMVAIVGSRQGSATALEESMGLAKKFATSGLCVVSGGAIGCDAMAHWGALNSLVRPAPTIVVLAGGIDQLYPRANNDLFCEILNLGGLFISERWPGSPCLPRDFPIRNRLISGLCRVVVVMQAARRSGALITARLALDQGRDVWVFKHPAHDLRANGSEELIQDGALAFGAGFGQPSYHHIQHPGEA